MGLIAWFKEKIKMLFKTDAEKPFKVETYLCGSVVAEIYREILNETSGYYEMPEETYG